MTEDQSYQLPTGDINLLGSTAKNGIASGCHDFNKYDPYVDRIRTLFVPSLEPRIHSCLETFVYRQESGQRSDPPYLKRCLDAAATLRDPVEAFCTKWRDSGFVETMLASVVKFLISNGPIDCFLNSIVLNNRLNKVCRDLDALGVEKDLLRYLAVWNYINERDYWLEDDKIISTPKSDESRDSVDRRSDLDVEVGSGLDSRRNDRSIRRAFKRRATDSSDDQDQSGRASQNFHVNGPTDCPFPSRLSIDSSNPEGSRSSSARKKIRSCQAHPCRAATCPSYRAKNPAPVNWEGKTLKLQLCKTSRASLDRHRERRRSSELSELDLPCKFDDLIAEIFKAHPTSSRRFFAQGRKKSKAGVTSVCSRVNETLGKIDRKEVARCRLQCEILPGSLSFRLIERDRDGSEVCLLSDRVPIDRIDDRQDNPRRSFASEPRQIGEQENADEADFTIYKNSGFSPADEESRIVGSLEEETAIKTEPEDVLLRPTDVDLEATARKNFEQLIEQRRREASNRSSEDKVGEPTCGCDTSLDDEEAHQRKEENDDEGSEPKSHPRESTGERSANRSNGSAIADRRDDHLEDKLDRTATNEENDEAVHRNNAEESARGESSMRSNGNLTEGQKCACSVSSDERADHLDRAIEADREASVIADSLEKIADLALEDAAEKDQRAKPWRTSSSSFSFKKVQPDVPTDNQVGKIACASLSNCVEENQAEECDSKCSCDCSREDQPRLLKKTEIIRMSSLLKPRTETLDSADQELPVPNSSQKTGALASASEELRGNCTEENQAEECDSKCSCDSCRREDEPRALKKTEMIRMSSLLKRRTETSNSAVQEGSRNPNSTQRNEALVSPRDEFECDCSKAQSSSFHSQDFEFRHKPSMKTDRPLENNATKTTSFVEAESQRIQRTSSATKFPRSLSSEEHPIASARLSLNNATKTMSFIEAESQRAQPDRSPAVQRTSSATNKSRRNISFEAHPIVSDRLFLNNYQPDVSMDNLLDKVACACPSDCTCPNRHTEENLPEECDSQCPSDTCREDEPRPSKRTEIMRMSSLLKRQTETLDSAVQESPDPTSNLKKGTFLPSASDEFPRSCTEAQTRRSHSQDLEIHAGPSVKSDTPLETEAAETMSFIDAESSPAQPGRGSAVQRTSSATNKSRRNISFEAHPIVSDRLFLNKYQPDVSMDNLLDKVACACPSDCTCPNRDTEENLPEECDSQCPCDTCREDEPRPSKRTEIMRMSSLLKRQTETLDSAVQESPDPTSSLKSGAFLPSASDEFHAAPSAKSDSPLESKAAEKMSFIDAESPPAQPDRGPVLRRTISATNKSRRNISSEERAIGSRLSRPKGQRINISIEVCPESESSSERTRRNARESASDELEFPKDVTLGIRKLRRHSLEPQPFEKQVLQHPDKDTRDQFLGQPRLTDAGVRSPPRPLESRDYLPRFRPPSSMRNPIVYPTSTKSRRRSIGELDGRSANQSRRRRGDSCVTKNRHASLQGKERANEEENPKDFSQLPKKPDAFSSGLRTNVAHALSASSVDRMKHLIRTKLRRMLLERDKATNTPKTTLTNRKYRVSVPGAKTDRSLFGQQACRTIWESRSASDSVRTSRSFASDDCKRPAATSEREEARKLSRSTGNPRISSSRSQNCGGVHRRFDGVNSMAANEREPEVDSGSNLPRLAGGSDFGSKMKRHENMHSYGKRENRCASQNKNGAFDDKFRNQGLKGLPEEIGDSSTRNSCEASRKKMSDHSAEFCEILRVAGNEREPEVDSGSNLPRLAGGSDFGSKMKRHENMHSYGKRENRCASQNKNCAFDEKLINQGLKGLPEEIGDSSTRNSCEASRKKMSDHSAEFCEILRVAGNEREPEVDSETNFPTLAEGSDFGSKRRHENMHSSGKRFDEKCTDHSCKGVPEEIVDSSAGNACDAPGKKIPEESSEFHGKLDWSGNSTSRHIYLFEFDRLVSSNDETESLGCCRSPRKKRLPEVRRTPRRNVDERAKKLIVSRARDSRSSRDRFALRETSAMSDCSSKMNNVSVSGARWIGAFGNIDQDLRKKLSQYVSLCKNVKYSLLKRLRPDDIYEVSRTSIPCCDRYKFGDT